MRHQWFTVLSSGLLLSCATGVEIEGFGGNSSSSDSGVGASAGVAGGTSQGGEGSGGEPTGGGNVGGTGGVGGAATTCGNGQLDPGETCDPPSSCLTTCDDADACTTDVLTGSSGQCNVACSHTAVTACVADGCCPAGCSSLNDSDCGSTYGPVHTFAGYSSSFLITQFSCSNAAGDPVGDAIWFCEHFYGPTCTAMPGVQTLTTSADAMMHSGTNCYSPEPVGVDVPGTQCIGGPCKIGNFGATYGAMGGITNIVCECP
jgi:hypothetical protein